MEAYDAFVAEPGGYRDERYDDYYPQLRRGVRRLPAGGRVPPLPAMSSPRWTAEPAGT